VANYREAHQLYASTFILFNHESPLRPERFVTQKIATAACRIANGSKETLKLGSINIARDGGWASNYVEAMWIKLQQKQTDDFVIATGQTHQLKDFIHLVFNAVGLKWEDYIYINPSLFRPTDIAQGHANSAKASRLSGWRASHTIEEVARLTI
jgi:GDPmannose 4,6-dehydratase